MVIGEYTELSSKFHLKESTCTVIEFSIPMCHLTDLRTYKGQEDTQILRAPTTLKQNEVYTMLQHGQNDLLVVWLCPSSSPSRQGDHLL